MGRGEGRLEPTLSLFDAISIGLGAIIGGGIFVVTGIAAGLAGPALILSILIAAIISLVTAMSFAELTAWLPAEGSVYEFSYRLVSPIVGYSAGWMWIVSNIFAGATVSLGFGYYLTALAPTLDSKLVAVILSILFTTLNCVGVHESAKFNNALVISKIVVLGIFIIAGLPHLNYEFFKIQGEYLSGILPGTFYIFFAYGGFARVAVIAEEVKDAEKTVPRAILIALVASAIIYILVGGVAVGLIGAERLGRSNSPLAEAMSAAGNPLLLSIVSIGGMLATASVLLTSILGVSRMAYAMSIRGDLPLFLGKIHPRVKTPYISVLMAGSVMAALILLLDLRDIVAVSTFGLLFNYSLANLSALKLDSKVRRYPRLLPAIGLATSTILLCSIQPSTLVMSIVFLLCGILHHMLRKSYLESGDK
ncbi:amino acid permease [Candidatus Bathyarchaeota archaeon]|nr:amino acid permease [Candidatus Bathyarchaeota archaeon]MBS7629095.1 amino acid permease [Candidatus Bathyarchaeota archaeon]